MKTAVATFNDLDKAKMAALKLKDAGFDSKVLNDGIWQRLLFLSKPIACFKVSVDESDYEKVRHALQEANLKESILKDEICCLKCGSPRVEYPHFSRNCFLPNLFAVMLGALRLTQKNSIAIPATFRGPSPTRCALAPTF